MKNLLIFWLSFVSSLLLTSCSVLPISSNVRTGTVKTIHNDTIQFYGSKRLYILQGKTTLNEVIQYTVIKSASTTKLCTIKKL